MKKQKYLDLKDKHRQEIEEFPIAYAFNDEQLKEALIELGVKSTDECVTVFGHGDIVKKENAKPFLDMLVRQSNELRDVLIADEELAEAAFLYEMDNHEYAINYDGDDDVLRCFGMDFNDLEDFGLADAYRRARNRHHKNMVEWGVF